MNIGNQIKNYRLAKGYKQEDLAKVLNISAQAVSKWETGASTPDITLLPSIAIFLGVTIDELFTMPETEQYEYIESMFWRERRIPQAAFENSVRFLQEQITKDTKNIRAHIDLASLYNHRAQSDMAEASEYAKRAIELDADCKEGWVAYKEANGAVTGDEWLDNHFEVVEFCKEILKKNPDTFWALRTIIENLIDDKRYEDAVPYVEQMKRVNPAFWAIPFYEGDIEAGSGYLDKAESLWDLGVALNPNSWQVYCSRADRIKKQGHIDDALADYEKCMEIQKQPRLTDPLYSMAQIHEQIGAYEEAIHDQERILQILEEEYNTSSGESVDSRKREIEQLRVKAKMIEKNGD